MLNMPCEVPDLHRTTPEELQENAMLSDQLLNILLKISPNISFSLRNFKRGNAWKYLVSESLVTTAILKLSNLFLVFTWMTLFCTAEELSTENENLLMAME